MKNENRQSGLSLNRRDGLEEEVSFVEETYLGGAEPESPHEAKADHADLDEEAHAADAPQAALIDESDSEHEAESEHEEEASFARPHEGECRKDEISNSSGAHVSAETLCEQTSDVDSFGLTPYELGRRGERAALRFLEGKDYEILDLNWTCFAGEADIVCLDGDTLCFVEVKTRRGAAKGFPEEAITSRKRARYEKIAGCYLREHDYVDLRVRFDVISIMVIAENRAFLRMHINAFGDGSLG